jgi:hypothetical protein
MKNNKLFKFQKLKFKFLFIVLLKMKQNHCSVPQTKKEYLNIWSKIKNVLKEKGIKEKEKLLYKESIGFDLIDKNK